MGGAPTGNMTTTNFILTRNSPLRTILVREDTNQPTFRIETPRKIIRQTTVIRKITPCEGSNSELPDPFKDDGSDSDESFEWSEDDLKDHKETDLELNDDEFARIHWHAFGSHRVIFQGRVWTRSQLLPKVGPLRGSYSFTANGVKYQWALGLLGTSTPKLILDDGSETVVAQFHRQNHIFNKRRAYLEITPKGMEILDHIVLTFVFVEKKRRDRERRTHQ